MGNASTESEVYQLHYSFSFIQKYILKFNIPVRNISLMTIVDCLNNLDPKKFRF